MNKRIVLKTIFICTGVFIVLFSTIIFFLLDKYEFENEERYEVAVAVTDISEGVIINESMLGIKTIRASGINSYMLNDLSKAIGKKTLGKIDKGDFVRNSLLISKDLWYKDEDRIIVLPMDIEARLANLIKRGTLIDIKVFITGEKSLPKTVLSKVRIEDILDENGQSVDSSIAGKKAYAKVILNEYKRNRIYLATQYGKLTYELYCDGTQTASSEDFDISNVNIKK